jgi:hypothetical protein
MKSLIRRVVPVLGIAAISLAANACSKDPTGPTPVLTTETFTGTITPLGSTFHTFNVNYDGGYSDASVTVTSLVSVADGSAKSITIGIGFGQVSVGVCNRAAQYTNVSAPVNVELPTSGGAFGPSTYCVSVFDNTTAPTVTEPLDYTLSVKHY